MSDTLRVTLYMGALVLTFAAAYWLGGVFPLLGEIADPAPHSGGTHSMELIR